MGEGRAGEDDTKKAARGRAILDPAELPRLRAEADGPAAGRAEAARIAFARAILKLLGERGHDGFTVAELVERAGSNRARFYAAWPDKDACLAEAWEAGADSLVTRLLVACEKETRWAAGVRAGLLELARLVDAEPGVMRGLVAGAVAVDAMSAAQREQVVGRLSRALDRARRETVSSRHPSPPSTSRFIIAAGEAAVLKFLADPTGRSFVEELPGLLYLTVVLYLGPEAADAEVLRLEG